MYVFSEHEILSLALQYLVGAVADPRQHQVAYLNMTLADLRSVESWDEDPALSKSHHSWTLKCLKSVKGSQSPLKEITYLSKLKKSMDKIITSRQALLRQHALRSMASDIRPNIKRYNHRPILL